MTSDALRKEGPQPNWTITSLVGSLTGYLAAHGSSTPRLDAELLVAHILKQPRIYLFTHFDQPVTSSERDQLRKLAVRRAAGEPIAYILGSQEFYGHKLEVDRRVLIPRPETELLIDEVLGHVQRRAPHSSERPLRVLDVGCGSGAIAIAIAHAVPTAHVIALDISREALAVARSNVAKHELAPRIELIEADLHTWPGPSQLHKAATPTAAQREPQKSAAALPGARFDIILANLPYIGEQERPTLPRSVVQFEPGVALFAPNEGRGLIEVLVERAPEWLAEGGLLGLEMAPQQVDDVANLCRRWGSVWTGSDLAGHKRTCFVLRNDHGAAPQPA